MHLYQLKNFDGSDTSIDNPVQNVESNAKTTAKDVSHEKENQSKEAPDKQKPVHNEQSNPNDAQQPIDEMNQLKKISSNHLFQLQGKIYLNQVFNKAKG